MYKVKKRFIATVASLYLFLFLTVGSYGVNAANFQFSPTSSSVSAGNTFTVQVVIDPGSDQVTSAQAIVKYDSTLLQAQTVTAGTYFPVVTNDITAGTTSIYGIFTEPGAYKTGTGTIATITFKALQSGTAVISYYCATGQNNSSKIIKNDVSSTNIIVCSQNGTHTSTISGASSGSNATATPTSAASSSNPTATPASSGGSTNSYVTPTPTVILPQALPRSGVVDETFKFVVPGLFLITIAGGLKLLF